jgi:ubiquinone/menaquinone biosynthesis C-methylase UbiE
LSISFDRVSTRYDASRGIPAEVSEQITQGMIQVVQPTSETQFFEPGVGTGRIALPFVQRGFAYTGVDLSEPMMDELRRKLVGLNHRLTLHQADVTALPFADRCFDVAIGVHLLHLVEDWRQALAEIRRVLKPSGVLLYSHGRTRPTSEAEASFNRGLHTFEQQWRSILLTYGYEMRYGAAEADVLPILQAQGAQLEPLVLARWRVSQTVATVLQSYQQRLYSPCWQVPEAIFLPAIEQLTQWCGQHYRSLEQDLSFENQFKLVVVRGWAG